MGAGRRMPDPIAGGKGGGPKGKSGSLDALRSDVGIVYAKGGPVAMAITVDEMPVIDYSPDNVGNVLIWQLASLLVDDLGAP